MSRIAALARCFWPDTPRRARLAAFLAVLTALGGCGSHSPYHAQKQYNPSRYYPPPGSHEDPWGPYIHEASGRFGVPEVWIRRVMRQESGGQEDVISWAGAMGLMQVMPDTYDGLRGRYDLGNDPFDPRNNILAGTAYLREMYDRFGAPGFLAAYNAGPNRLDRYLNDGAPLPAETVNYVASIAPLLGTETPMSGPLAIYAGPATRFAARSTPAGCDPDAAFNPDGPCTALRPAVIRTVAVAPSYAPSACDPDAAYNPDGPCVALRPVVERSASAQALPAQFPSGQPLPAQYALTPLPPAQPAGQTVATATRHAAAADCDPDAAYDPTQPCRPLSASTSAVAKAVPRPVARRPAEYAMAARPIQERVVQPAAFIPWDPPGRWAIQVGAFANLAMAQAAAEKARSAMPDVLRTAKVELPATTPFGSQVAFRARLFGLSSSAAADACARLSGRGMACMTVPPARDTY